MLHGRYQGFQNCVPHSPPWTGYIYFLSGIDMGCICRCVAYYCIVHIVHAFKFICNGLVHCGHIWNGERPFVQCVSEPVDTGPALPLPFRRTVHAHHIHGKCFWYVIHNNRVKWYPGQWHKQYPFWQTTGKKRAGYCILYKTVSLGGKTIQSLLLKGLVVSGIEWRSNVTVTAKLPAHR